MLQQKDHPYSNSEIIYEIEDPGCAHFWSNFLSTNDINNENLMSRFFMGVC